MKSRIVISDIHGCYKTFMGLLLKLPIGVPITIAGDLIDRGPDSKSVVQHIIDNKYDCVLGNHEKMMIDELRFTSQPTGILRPFTDLYNGIWQMNGGTMCLESYKNPDGTYDTDTLIKHRDWMKALPYYIEYTGIVNSKNDYLLVSHSTAAYVWEDESHDSNIFKDNLLWERTPFPQKIPGIYNVYGHTPQKDQATVKDHFACIDGGAYFKRKPYGKLIALQYPEMTIYEQENLE